VSIRRTYHLEGLNCASCAAKIAGRIRALEGVSGAEVDVASSRLWLEISDDAMAEEIVRQAKGIVHHYEPEVGFAEVGARARSAQTEEAGGGIWKERLRWISLGLGMILFVAGLVWGREAFWGLWVFLASYGLVGGRVLWRAARNILRGEVFDEHFLMSVATIGAFAIGEYPEGVAVMLFYRIGEAFQEMAVGRSRRSITAMMDLRPDFANLREGESFRRVSPEDVRVGEEIVVRPGERVPLDGVVLGGRSTVDTSALTGESLPREVEIGDEVLSGAINKTGLLTVRVTKAFGESTVSKILELVQNASSKKARAENFITKFARYYTPAVVFSALALALIPPLVWAEASFSDWTGRALVFLVVSCPCALVISIPLSFFGGIGGASRQGILVKGSNYLDALFDVDTVVFDKTGTLTEGKFRVSGVYPAQGWDEAQLIEYAAHAESGSMHPIAASIREAYGGAIRHGRVTSFEEVAGRGVKAEVDGRVVLAGGAKWLSGVSGIEEGVAGTVTHVAVDGVYAGYVVVSDRVKADSVSAIRELRALGVRRTAMLTGDSCSVGASVGEALGIDVVACELLPQQKVVQLEALQADKTTRGALVFAGDGINDAPVLARADVGVAMGGMGTDAAIEAADVVLMTDEPSKIATAIRIARKTRGIVWQNIALALGVKAVVLVLGALGMASMAMAVFADVGVALIAILNAMRAMRV